MKSRILHVLTVSIVILLLLYLLHWIGKYNSSPTGVRIHNIARRPPWRWSNGVCSRGLALFSNNWIKTQLVHFLQVYDSRPGQGNRYGTSLMHQFALWCLVRNIKPKFIIESGVNLGLGTWILRQAAPNAKLVLLDPKNRTNMVYRDRSNSSVYMGGGKFQDFSKVDWTSLVVPSETLVFIDDHQKAFDRIEVAMKWGFVHLVFDDNYWNGGDVFSLKKACALFLGRTLGSLQWTVNNNGQGRKFQAFSDSTERREMNGVLSKYVDTYYEFPLLWKAFGTNTNNDNGNILHKENQARQVIPKYFNMSNYPPEQEINYYCNIAYVRLVSYKSE